jgi:hypothetical protein
MFALDQIDLLVRAESFALLDGAAKEGRGFSHIPLSLLYETIIVLQV